MSTFWYKFFGIVKVRFLFQSLLAGMSIMMCYAIGFLSAVLFDHFYLEEEFSFNDYKSDIIVPQDKNISISHFSELVLNNLINTTEAPLGLLDEGTKKSNSNLDAVILIGTTIWTDRSLAILSTDNKIKVVVQGNDIPDSNIKLVKVERGRILLSSGKLERWVEINRNLSSKTASRRANKKDSTNQPSASPRTSASGGIQLDPIIDNQQNVFIQQDRVEHELNNFAQFLNQARVFPNFVDDKPSGYVIRSITPGSIYEQLGLKNEDVIKSVNGEIIDSPERAFELFKLLRNERLVNLSIERAESPLNMDFHIN
ncbi:MAG: hypothetical protein JJV97_00755 [SAR324 cluster bacterium]|nr:hypothetical protein [SAR324 cluster bacterium]